MQYALINFTRLGDLLQSQSTIKALKKEGHKISLICLEQFASAANMIEELDDISIFPGTKVLREINNNWLFAYESLSTWLESYYQKFPYDCVLNLTPSTACRTLSGLLAQKANVPIYGFGIDKFGYNYNSSSWTTYIQAVTAKRNCSPFNLIDTFRSMLNLGKEEFKLNLPESVEKSVLEMECAKYGLDYANSNFIGFQLGASSEIRQWPVENFAKLAKLVWENKMIPVLLGTKAELDLTEQFKIHAKNEDFPYLNLCGKTSLPELGQVVTKFKALVSNDTGTLHLAVGLNVPVLGIYLATAQVWDTGPYNLDNLCLEPLLDCHPCDFNIPCQRNYQCHKSISALTVFTSLKFLLKLKNNDLSSLTFPDNYQLDARIWQSFFDDDGFINYKDLTNLNEERTFWIYCQRILYKNLMQSLEQKNVNTLVYQDIKNKEFLNKVNPEFIDSVTNFLDRLITLLLLAKEQGTMLKLKLKPNQKSQEFLLATIQRVELYLKQNPNFSALLLLWKNLLQENSNDLDQLINFIGLVHAELYAFNDFFKKH